MKECLRGAKGFCKAENGSNSADVSTGSGHYAFLSSSARGHCVTVGYQLASFAFCVPSGVAAKMERICKHTDTQPGFKTGSGESTRDHLPVTWNVKRNIVLPALGGEHVNIRTFLIYALSNSQTCARLRIAFRHDYARFISAECLCAYTAVETFPLNVENSGRKSYQETFQQRPKHAYVNVETGRSFLSYF